METSKFGHFFDISHDFRRNVHKLHNCSQLKIHFQFIFNFGFSTLPLPNKKYQHQKNHVLSNWPQTTKIPTPRVISKCQHSVALWHLAQFQRSVSYDYWLIRANPITIHFVLIFTIRYKVFFFQIWTTKNRTKWGVSLDLKSTPFVERKHEKMTSSIDKLYKYFVFEISHSFFCLFLSYCAHALCCGRIPDFR